MDKKKVAVIFGGKGQAGIYLCDQLLADGFTVHNMGYDITDLAQVYYVLTQTRPTEVYNVAGKQFAPNSWEDPKKYFEVNGGGVLNILDVLYKMRMFETSFVTAGSAEMFGPRHPGVMTIWSDQEPNNPYGLAKKFAFEITKMYRDVKGLKCCTAVFSNMESPFRNDFFFAEKIVSELKKRLGKGLEEHGKIKIGSINAVRDWGFTPDYMRAMRMMARQEHMKDHLIATGESHSCSEFIFETMRQLGIHSPATEFSKYFDIQDDGKPQSKMVFDIEDTVLGLGWEPKYKFKDVILELING